MLRNTEGNLSLTEAISIRESFAQLRRHPIAGAFFYLTLAFAAFSMFFSVLPQFDLAVSSLCYNTDHAQFIHGESRFCTFFSKIIPIFTWTFAIALLVTLYLRMRSGGVPASVSGWVPSRRCAAYLLLVGLIGPGLAVNGILKNFWGRERPRSVVEFGGGKTYTAPLELSSQTGKSFPSGDVSMAFLLVAVALVAPAAWRRPLLIVSFAVGGLTGISRILKGAHFLSDVLAGAWVTIAVAYILYVMFFGFNAQSAPDDL